MKGTKRPQLHIFAVKEPLVSSISEVSKVNAEAKSWEIFVNRACAMVEGTEHCLRSCHQRKERRKSCDSRARETDPGRRKASRATLMPAFQGLEPRKHNTATPMCANQPNCVSECSPTRRLLHTIGTSQSSQGLFVLH